MAPYHSNHVLEPPPPTYLNFSPTLLHSTFSHVDKRATMLDSFRKRENCSGIPRSCCSFSTPSLLLQILFFSFRPAGSYFRLSLLILLYKTRETMSRFVLSVLLAFAGVSSTLAQADPGVSTPLADKRF